MNDFGAIFPTRYVPPFLRNQFVAEEVVRHKWVVAGQYDPKLIRDCTLSYIDGRNRKRVFVVFDGGHIFKLEEDW